ncbi:sulfatase [Bordetella sp. H567]|uniref:sulfatase-like hydrolase/transferase n=1 Tax=Bordetella sp. H567 TaxID=1697043 RepID=UPI00081C8AA0|nr:sulfatase-like hydrolase/transferase [Bordetella sp. H567]AOB31757.1 sulfatase [Bordetella sp. H567]
MNKAKNLLIVMNDEHSRKALGCYGHPFVRTPNLDKLAGRGMQFNNAYSASPICVPARGAIATGRYVHEIGCWDNANAYDGTIPSWHHLLREQGHEVISIGKLHFQREGQDHGFDREIVPMHLAEGRGALISLLRDPTIKRGTSSALADTAGPGESAYTRYDREISAHAQVWLRETAPTLGPKPWALFVSFVAPHFPLTCPPEFYYQYPLDRIDVPKLHGRQVEHVHPYVKGLWSYHRHADFFKDDMHVRKAIAAYYGLCTFIDGEIGKVLGALDSAGLADETRVIYTSDHGDNLGTRGLWGKNTMYEESVGVPLIVAGPDVPHGVCDTPVSHIDMYPYILESVGAQPDDAVRPGVSLSDIWAGRKAPPFAFSEYHASGSVDGVFMIRTQRYKYIFHVALLAELYDLERDPEELDNLAENPDYVGVVAELKAMLFTLCDPFEVDRAAKRRQAELIEQNGGREAVLSRGDFGNTPAPGTKVVYEKTQG